MLFPRPLDVQPKAPQREGFNPSLLFNPSLACAALACRALCACLTDMIDENRLAQSPTQTS